MDDILAYFPYVIVLCRNNTMRFTKSTVRTTSAMCDLIIFGKQTESKYYLYYFQYASCEIIIWIKVTIADNNWRENTQKIIAK